MSVSRQRPLFLVLMFLVSQFYFLQSPLFQFNQIEIEGASKVSEDKIESRLGLREHTSFWDVSTDSLQENLSSLRMLQHAQVDLEFPGRVSVTISERKPSFLAAYIGNTKEWYSMDSEGLALESLKPTGEALRILLPYPVRTRTQVRASDLYVVKFFQENLSDKLRERVTAVKINQTHDVALRLKYGGKSIWVRLGRPEKLEYKLFLLSELISKLKRDGATSIESIDLRYSAPVVKSTTPPAPAMEAEATAS